MRLLTGVMILNRDGAHWLPPLLHALEDQAAGGVRVYLVDNASTDGSVAETRARFPAVTVLRLPANLGYSMAYNLAMPHAFADGCEWVVWANNDIRLEPGCLSELLRAVGGASPPGVLGPAFLAWEGDDPGEHMQGTHPQAIQAMRERQDTPIAVEMVEGSFLMVSRRCVEDVGPLDPAYFFYWEEADFCRRARYRGWTVALVPSALARHYAGGSTGRRKDDAFYRLKVRNHYLYTLTDPFRGWARNCVEALLLLAVRLKACALHAEGPWWTEVRVFASLAADWPTVRSKWARDRSGDKPRATQGLIDPVVVEVLDGKGAAA